MDQNVVISRVTSVSSELITAIRHLLYQLDPDLNAVTKEQLEKLLMTDQTYLFLATDSRTKKIIGTLTLTTAHLLEGIRGYIDDLVVDESARGKGVGRSLMEKAITFAKEEGVYALYLTSRPSRETANRLYLKLGFAKRETNLYKLTL